MILLITFGSGVFCESLVLYRRLFEFFFKKIENHGYVLESVLWLVLKPVGDEPYELP